MRLLVGRVQTYQLRLPFLLLPLVLACPFDILSPMGCRATLLHIAEVEAVYQGFVPSLRTTPTRPLLGVIPRWQAAMCVIPRWILSDPHTGRVTATSESCWQCCWCYSASCLISGDVMF